MTDPRVGSRLLAGDLLGVYRWPDGDDVDPVADAVARAGWRVVGLDTDEADSSQGLLEACAAAFGFPDWFGLNFDALDESLADLDLAGARGLLVVWSGWGEFAEADPAGMAVALDVFATAVNGWSDDGLPATVLVTGPGPDLGLRPV